MTISEKMREDLNIARRERDKLRTLVLGMTLSEAKNREIELGRALSDEEFTEIVGRAIKRRRESSEQFRAANRTELADKEEQEAGLLKGYLPEQLTEAEVRGFVRDAVAAGATTMGAVMAAVMPKVKGKFDGRETNRIVKEELG
jgi:uncharacterized protein